MDKIHGEKFYKIKGFEEYAISKSGKIYSFLTKRFLKPDYSTEYGRVRLHDMRLNKYIRVSVHRLVALQFLPNPRNLPDVNHKDGNKRNNSVYNLEWCTAEYNNRHAIQMGLTKVIEQDNPNAKLSREDVIKIHWFYRVRHYTVAEIARIFNVTRVLVSNIVRGLRWSELYKELYGEYTSVKREHKRIISDSLIEAVLKGYYLDNKSALSLEREFNITNGYISKLTRGYHIKKSQRYIFEEIVKVLGNQQPRLCSESKVQRLKSACQLLKIDNDIV